MNIDDKEYKRVMLETARKRGKINERTNTTSQEPTVRVDINGRLFDFKQSTANIIQENKDSILADYNSGEVVTSLSKKYNLTTVTINRFIRLSSNIYDNKTLSKEDLKEVIQKARQELESGVDISQLVKKYDLSSEIAETLVRNLKMRNEHRKGLSSMKIAKRYNLSQSAAHNIIRNKTKLGM